MVVLIVNDVTMHLGALASETAGKLDVLGLDGDTASVDGAQVGVLDGRQWMVTWKKGKMHTSKSETR